jgi:hypothetical protein
MRYRHCVGAAMTMAVMGYHLQVMTRRLSQAAELAILPSSRQGSLPVSTGEQAQ